MKLFRIAIVVLTFAFAVEELQAQCKIFGGRQRRQERRAGNGGGSCGNGACGPQSQGYSYGYVQSYSQPVYGYSCVNGVCYPNVSPQRPAAPYYVPQAPNMPLLPQAPSSSTSTEFEEIAAIRAQLNDLNARISRLEAKRQ